MGRTARTLTLHARACGPFVLLAVVLRSKVRRYGTAMVQASDEGASRREDRRESRHLAP